MALLIPKGKRNRENKLNLKEGPYYVYSTTLHRFGAIGKHGSIAVTERVNKTLKYEWLKRVAIIKDFDHLNELCSEFETWYNNWRPHMTLDGLRPDDVYYDKKPVKPKHDAKTVPSNIEQRFFPQTRITGYRLAEAA